MFWGLLVNWNLSRPIQWMLTIRSGRSIHWVKSALEDGGTILYDSRVIVEYLDARAGGGKLIPAAGAARFETLTRAALMDGIMDAAILVVYEGRMRPEDKYVESFVTYQREKIQRGLEVIAASSPQYRNGAMPDAGEIALACVLDYLDFRQQLNWRDHAANLQDWLGDFAAAVPGYREHCHLLHRRNPPIGRRAVAGV